MKDSDQTTPPRWFRALLRLALAGHTSRECFVGDLIEERTEMLQRTEPVESRHLWYARQLLSVVSHGRLTVILAAAVCVTILLSNGLFPLLGIDIPEFPAANVVFFGGLALAWASAGFIAYRRTGVVADGPLAGATSALLTMTVAMTTFAVVEPNRANLAAFELLPMFVLVGAVFGWLGSGLGRFAAPVHSRLQ